MPDDHLLAPQPANLAIRRRNRIVLMLLLTAITLIMALTFRHVILETKGVANQGGKRVTTSR